MRLLSGLFCMVLGGCASYSDSPWPDLTTGFEQRGTATTATEAPVAVSIDAYEATEEETRLFEKVQANIVAQKSQFLESLSNLSTKTGEEFQRDWLGAQLQLSSIARALDRLTLLANLSGAGFPETVRTFRDETDQWMEEQRDRLERMRS